MIDRMKILKPSWMTVTIIFMISCLSIQNYRNLPLGKDIVFATIYWHGPVLFSQTILLFFIAWQVSSFRKIQLLVAVRGMDDLIQKKLFSLVTFEVLSYFIWFDASFLLTGHSLFIDGSPVIGICLLLFRIFIIWFLGLLLISVYASSYPGIILFSVLVLNLFYHYIIETLFLLGKYSQYYDPLWRIIHQK